VAADTPEQAAAQLNSDANRLADNKLVAKILKASAKAMKFDVRENFDKQAGPDGRPWKRLKFPHIRGGDVPLNDTGRLRASLVSKTKDSVEVFTINSVEIGTTKEGANLMNAGGTVVPVKAKALAIPLTKEALRAGGPRRFPRPLRVLWRKGAKSGVLAEIDKDKLKATEKEKERSKVIRTQSAVTRQLNKLAERLRKRMNRTKNPANKKKLAKQIASVRLKQSKASTKAANEYRKRQKSRDKRKDKSMVLQYALVKSVTVPARPFVGFGQRLITTLETISHDAMASAVGAKQPGGAI